MLGTGRSNNGVEQHWGLMMGHIVPQKKSATGPAFMQQLNSPISKAAMAPVDRSALTVATTVGARRRCFEATSILASTAASTPGALPLSHSAVGVCDRLATVVVQQLTQRSWQRAQGAKIARHRLTSHDVLEIVREPGTFDFLHEANVVSSLDA